MCIECISLYYHNVFVKKKEEVIVPVCIWILVWKIAGGFSDEIKELEEYFFKGNFMVHQHDTLIYLYIVVYKKEIVSH